MSWTWLIEGTTITQGKEKKTLSLLAQYFHHIVICSKQQSRMKLEELYNIPPLVPLIFTCSKYTQCPTVQSIKVGKRVGSHFQPLFVRFCFWFFPYSFCKNNSTPDLTSCWATNHPSEAQWQRASCTFTCTPMGLKL
jgi:hypothetical protein